MLAYFYFIFHIQIFFLDNFRYVAKGILFENRAIQLSCLINPENIIKTSKSQRKYFNIYREKPDHKPDTPYIQPLSCELEWINQNNFFVLFFFLL